MDCATSTVQRRFLELANSWYYFLVPDNLSVFAFNARVAQFFDDLISVNKLVRLYGRVSWSRVIVIIGTCWLYIFDFAIVFKI